MKVLVCGAGVIGASVAYFLASRGAEVEIVERTAVACAASGKAGGFLALDWCDGTPLEALARRSFELHSRLPEVLESDWGYRRMTAYAGFSGAAPATGAALPWLSPTVAVAQKLGTAETTAQVHPALFTHSLIAAAERLGAKLRIGEVTGLVRDSDGRVRGALLRDERVEADATVLAMGPWTRRAAGWLPLPDVHGLKGHSVVFRTGDRIPAEALFLEHRGAEGASSPEIYPRADGTTYVCALSSGSPVPSDPAEVGPDPGADERLQAICAELSPILAGAPVLARQACHRPVTSDGLPLIGPVPDASGAFIATGHSVWGILNAPATGEAMAGLILDGRAAIDLSAFDPGRLAPAGRDGLA
jgi:glycine/D-amino acid oxidase-like deaminating enzyme